MRPAPEPGIYPGVPMREYLEWDCASASRLTDMMRSAAYCRWQADHPSDPTPAQELGTAIHCAVLEPERFEQTYRLRPPGDGRTTAVKDARNALLSAGFSLLDEAGWQACEEISRSIRLHPAAQRVLAHGRECEVSIVAEIEGVKVKIRPDLLCRAAGLIGDLKSTSDPDPLAFAKQACNLGYHRSAALYMDAARAVGLSIDYYAFLVLAKDPPYEVAVCPLLERAVDLGRCEYLPLLHRYQWSAQSGVWPALSDELFPIDLPAWAYSRQEVAA